MIEDSLRSAKVGEDLALVASYVRPRYDRIVKYRPYSMDELVLLMKAWGHEFKTDRTLPNWGIAQELLSVVGGLFLAGVLKVETDPVQLLKSAVYDLSVYGEFAPLRVGKRAA